MCAWLLENLILVITQRRLFDELLRHIKSWRHISCHIRVLELISYDLGLLEVLLLLWGLAEVNEMSFLPDNIQLRVALRVQEQRIFLIIVLLHGVDIQSLLSILTLQISLTLLIGRVDSWMISVLFKVRNDISLLSLRLI